MEEPTNERLWLHLASAQYLSGNPVAALDTISEARRSLDELVGVAPGPELTELQRRMLDHDDVEASYYRLTGVSLPPVRLGAPRRSSACCRSLPLPGGHLVGRDEVIADLVSAVDDGPPVLTITGPGGMGKTRCAVEVPAGEHALPRFHRPERAEHRGGSRAAPRRDVRGAGS